MATFDNSAYCENFPIQNGLFEYSAVYSSNNQRQTQLCAKKLVVSCPQWRNIIIF